MKRNNKISIKDVSYLIYWFISPLIFWGMLSLLFGCKQVNEPEPFDITGVYQSVDYEGEFRNGYELIIFLVHTGKTFSGTGEFNGSPFSFQGIVKGNQFITQFLLIYQGYFYSCKIDLFYSEAGDYYPLSGGFTMNSTKAIRFKKSGELK